MTFGLHPLVAVFMAGWLSLVAIAGIVVLLAGAAKQNPIALMPVGMFLFGCLLTTGAFSFEARKAKQLLLSLLEGTELAPDARERPGAAYR